MAKYALLFLALLVGSVCVMAGKWDRPWGSLLPPVRLSGVNGAAVLAQTLWTVAWAGLQLQALLGVSGACREPWQRRLPGAMAGAAACQGPVALPTYLIGLPEVHQGWPTPTVPCPWPCSVRP